MLILTRSIDQSIFVGEEIAVKVLGVKDDNVRLGIQAPREAKIQRQEDFQRLKDDTFKT
jgi:carbon storage regulator